MAWPNDCPSYRPSCFFVEHTGRLSSLLDLVIKEANASTEPCFANDYAEMINVLRDLLAQAQVFSSQGPEYFRGRWQEVQVFASRAQAVQDAIGNRQACLQASGSPSKKRGRSETLDVDTNVIPDLKRSRSQDEDGAMTFHGFTSVVPIRPAAPSRKESSSQWEMQT